MPGVILHEEFFTSDFIRIKAPIHNVVVHFSIQYGKSVADNVTSDLIGICFKEIEIF